MKLYISNMFFENLLFFLFKNFLSSIHGQNWSFLSNKQKLPYRGFLGHWIRIRGWNCKIQNGGSNMAAKISIFCKSNSILPKGVFRRAESESEVKIAKFKMADPIWRQKFRFSANQTVFCLKGVFGALSPNPRTKLRNSKWRIQYGGQNFNYLQIKQYFA